MMQANLSFTLLNATVSDLIFSGGGRDQPLMIVRRPRARAMRLSVDHHDATVRLSLPTRAPLRDALVWAQGKRDWIETELARLPAPQPIISGMTFCFAGQQVQLDWSQDYARTPVLVGETLQIGGPSDVMAMRLLRWLKQEAQKVLERETRALADSHAITIARVGVGDPRGRWGSCASSGLIRYSWRLILMPDDVRQSIVAHEVAHRIHMNHSPHFHALVRDLLGRDPGFARRWLRANGPALHWFGRAG